MRDAKELCNGEGEIQNLVGTSKRCTHFSSRPGRVIGSYFVGWQMLRLLGSEFIPNHKKCLQVTKNAIFG